MALLALAGCRRSTFPDYPAGYREFAYVANTGSNTVTVLDLVYLRADRTLQVGSSPVALAANPKRDEVYVLNAQLNAGAGSLTIIDTQRNEVAATIPLRRNPVALSVDRTKQLAFIAESGANAVAVVDLRTRRTIYSLATAEHPASALIAPDGRTLLVTHPESGSVSLYTSSIVTDGPKHVGDVTLRHTYAGCPGAAAPVILPDSSKALIACSAGHHVMVLSLAADPASWNAKQEPALLADHLVALLDVGRNPSYLTMKPDGGEVFVSNATSDSISEISTQTNEVGSTYPIGNHPAQGVVSGDNSALWIANTGADSLSLYSIEDGKPVSSFHTGTAPGAMAFSADEHLLLVADKGSGDVAVIHTNSRLGPAFFTMLPAGPGASAIVVQASGVAAKP